MKTRFLTALLMLVTLAFVGGVVSVAQGGPPAMPPPSSDSTWCIQDTSSAISICHWEKRCYVVGGNVVCYWIWVCPFETREWNGIPLF